MNAVLEMPTRVPALMSGGHVSAIIPRSVEEIWRVSKMVVVAGLAPAALVDKKAGDDAVSAVCVAIMSGAELGLPPMVALRSFTVINGKPALYGDGLINVCRRSGKAEYIRTGYDKATGVGWCEAKRNDTGEEKRVEFSLEDARHAGLYEDKPIVKRKSFKTGEFYEKPNDAPWYRYPQRMAPWRAAGYCLRDLFADVLGGMPTEDEAQEIAGHDAPMRDVTPLSPPSPPRPPSPPVEEAETVDASEIIPETGESTDAILDGEPFDLEAFLTELDDAMATGANEDAVIEIWDGYDVEAILTDDEEALQRAFDMRGARLTAHSTLNAG